MGILSPVMNCVSSKMVGAGVTTSFSYTEYYTLYTRRITPDSETMTKHNHHDVLLTTT